MITSDDRVAELIEEVNTYNHPCCNKTRIDHAYPAFDMVVVPLATGSREYISWVKLQTLKRDPSQAFFNAKMGAPMEALNNTIPDIGAAEALL
jgi:hypothetical protein